MKVLHVIPSVSGQAGGPSQAILPMCRALGAQGVELLLATTDDGLAGENGIGVQLGQPTDYNGQPTIFFPSQFGASFKYSRPFAEWLSNNVADFDLVHIHAVFNHACIAAARACRERKVPYIVRPLGTLDPWAMNQKSWRKRVFWHGGVKNLLSSAAAIHYTAKAEQDATESSLGLNHGVVVPLGVETKEPDAVPSAEDLSLIFPALEGHPYVLVLSRLLPTKGIDVLLQAFLSLLDQSEFKHWRLVLAGEGPKEYVASLEQLAGSAKATASVLFPGWLTGKPKEILLQNAALLALPSYHENFGLCVMEALSYGVPVLVSPHVNLSREVAAAEAGWIAPVEKAAIATALASALRSRSERSRRGEAGADLARAFRWPGIAEQLIALYESVIDNRRLIAPKALHTT